MAEPTFGELLRAFRSAAGLSQEELAERARLSSGAISALERGVRRSPQHQTLGLLAEALRLPQADRERLESAAAGARRRGARTSIAGAEPLQHRLPNVLTSFHGRERALGELDVLTRTRRIITLLGPGGVGKTRLSLEAARSLASSGRFDDVWFVELAPLGDPTLVTTAIAQIAGIRERTGEMLIDTLAAAIDARRVLLMLDNCEHVIAECANVAERLTRSCAGLVIVATTREALRVDGEVVLRVEPLTFEQERRTGPALDVLLDRLADADFVRFSTLSESDRGHAASICERLDGIPLALELAAGRARELTLGEIVAGLDERFALLAEGKRTASPRQHTLRGMIDWSYALLPEAERRLFGRLGLFADGFTSEAAVAICGDDADGARDALAALIAKSMIVVDEDVSGRLRYRFLQTMRAYALDRLREDPDAGLYARRFALHFTAAAHAADARYGRIGNDAFLASVEPDLDNFRAALEWTLGDGNDVRLGAELAGAMGWIYRQTSLFAEGARWFERALDANAGLDPAIAGRLHMAASFVYFNTGRLPDALAAAERATRAFEKPVRASDLTWALTQQAYCFYLLGRVDDASAAATRAAGVAREQDDPLRLAGALNALSITIPIERAAERFGPLEEAIRAYRAAGDEGAVVPTANLAETHYATGNFEAALAAGLDVVAMTRKNRDRSNLAAALTNVAAYALTLDRLDQANAAAREALALARPLGKTLNAMCSLQHLGSVAARRGDYVRAARLAGAANRLYADFGLTREYTEQSLYERLVEDVLGALGAGRLDEELRAGGALPIESAIDEALASA